jgi:uncharacterized membrane protein YphA (DoxX/SURF4 family)
MTTTTMRSSSPRGHGNKIGNIALWTAQVLLAALFVFAGAMKFVMTVEEMTRQMELPGWFLHFVGACEILGGVGLVLPAALGILPWLTPLAAALLVPIMVGAAALSLSVGGASAAIMPFVLGLACAFIAHRRRMPRAGGASLRAAYAATSGDAA